MGIFSSKQLNSFEDLLLLELNDLYDGEQRMIDGLETLMNAAASPSLKQAFNDHLTQTKRHLSRLEQIFVELGKPSGQETCYAMKGLIKEGAEVCDAEGSSDVKDAALISAAQRVEHYEIAAYGSARTFAEHLGHTNIARLLQTTLDEEKETDVKLTRLAEENINLRAAAHTGMSGPASWEG